MVHQFGRRMPLGHVDVFSLRYFETLNEPSGGRQKKRWRNNRKVSSINYSSVLEVKLLEHHSDDVGAQFPAPAHKLIAWPSAPGRSTISTRMFAQEQKLQGKNVEVCHSVHMWARCSFTLLDLDFYGFLVFDKITRRVFVYIDKALEAFADSKAC